MIFVGNLNNWSLPLRLLCKMIWTPPGIFLTTAGEYSKIIMLIIWFLFFLSQSLSDILSIFAMFLRPCESSLFVEHSWATGAVGLFFLRYQYDWCQWYWYGQIFSKASWLSSLSCKFEASQKRRNISALQPRRTMTLKLLPQNIAITARLEPAVCFWNVNYFEWIIKQWINYY